MCPDAPIIPATSCSVSRNLSSRRVVESWKSTFSKKFWPGLVTVVVAWLGAKGKGGKPITKIRKLNLRLLRRRENAVQRTPPRAHSPASGAGYGTYDVTSTKLERWEVGVFSVPVYNLLEHFLSRFQMWTFHFALNATFSIGFGNAVTPGHRVAWRAGLSGYAVRHVTVVVRSESERPRRRGW
jgi:hypothetical protein